MSTASVRPATGPVPPTFVLRPLPAGPPIATGRRIVATGSGYPCRRCLRDAEPGEAVILLSYDPFLGGSVYAQPGPVFVHEHECSPPTGDGLPDQLVRRLLSVRAFDPQHSMLDAAVTPGTELEAVAQAFLARPEVEYLHVHFAGAGCFAVRIDRR